MLSDYYNDVIYPLIWPLVYIVLPVGTGLYILNWYFSDSYVVSKYRAKGHSWRSIQQSNTIPYNVLCSVCERLMLSSLGHYCERCALSACRGCRRSADRATSCRLITAPPNRPFNHHWVKVGAACEECGTGLVEGSGCDFFCCWCQRIFHSSLGTSPLDEVCDFGPLRKMIVPPTSVSIDPAGNITVTPPDWPDWRPLIVIGNPKSGGQAGEEVLSAVRGLLSPLQVVRLGRTGLGAALRWAPPQARVLVAGGDGSAAAVLTAIAEIFPHPGPALGILPLGTGNDLSRVLGWGGSSSSPLSAMPLMEDVFDASIQSLDRWSVRVGRKQMYAYNYVSVGVDARVALDFHRARRHPLYLCGSQTFNYLIYLFLGTQQAVSQDCLGLEKILELTVDGQEVELPPLQALLLLNIPSWGAGVDVWNAGADDDVPPQSFSDGRFEILGIRTSFHIAQLQVGLSQPIRLGQGSHATIKVKGKVPMQVDGEPWEQKPCDVHVGLAGSSAVLTRQTPIA